MSTRLGGYIVNLCHAPFILTGPWPPFCSFRSWTCVIQMWSVPVFQYSRTVFSPQWNVYKFFTKTASIRIVLNIDGVPVASKSHTHPSSTLSNLSSINLVSIFRCSSPPINPVYVSRVDLSPLSFRLSSHRHSYISLLFAFYCDDVSYAIISPCDGVSYVIVSFLIPNPQHTVIVVYVYISRISMVGSVGFVLSEISGDNWTNLTKPSEYAYSSVL
jgi:hypothetical protein